MDYHTVKYIQNKVLKPKIDTLTENFEDKLDQNEDLAKLRAGVSLAKSGVNEAKVMIEDFLTLG